MDSAQIVRISAGIDPWPALASYIGIFCVGFMFLPIDLFVSSLVKGQMIAALISIAIGAAFTVLPGMFSAELDPNSPAFSFFTYWDVPRHFSKDFTRGVIDTRHLVFYFAAGWVFLFLTVR